MKKQKASVVDSPILRPLDGPETSTVIVDRIRDDFKVELLRSLEGSNNFLSGDSYPSVTVDGVLKVKVLPLVAHPAPFYVNVHLHLGSRLETAPDKLREQHGIPVLQPQKLGSGFIANQPVKQKENDNGDKESSKEESGGERASATP